MQLEPCPFCGEGEHLLVEHLEGTILHPAHRIRCDNCGASTGYTDRDFRAFWNARACVSSATEALRAEVAYRDGVIATHSADTRDYQKLIREAEHRAERLAEALRSAVDLVERDVIQVRPSDRGELITALTQWNAALEQEAGRG
jgi:hypothetical protein